LYYHFFKCLKAETTGMNPLYLMIPATIHCSYAFMLPVGTPPNAIVLEAGKIEPSHLVIIILYDFHLEMV